jgi:hypothetical protein
MGYSKWGIPNGVFQMGYFKWGILNGVFSVPSPVPFRILGYFYLTPGIPNGQRGILMGYFLSFLRSVSKTAKHPN